MRNAVILLLFFGLSSGATLQAQYTGTGSVTQGLGTITQPNLYACTNGRITDIGICTAFDSSVWIVPAPVNFTNAAFPFASDLYNPCTGATYPNESAALAALNPNDIVTIDPSGELFTAYIFADNYFELYVNGTAVGKDNIPYTQFNSNVIRFRVNRPFTLAALLVDWEEKLGIGCEVNSGFQYFMGDGGFVAVIKDSAGQIMAKTGSDWKAQTFYTAPIVDLTCATESGNLRLSSTCSTQSSNSGTAYYGLHWPIPSNWMTPAFNDSLFPFANTYSNSAVGVNNKPSYTNFTSVFDDPVQDAEFIWSTNLVLDNLVLVRYTVPLITGSNTGNQQGDRFQIFPNPATNQIRLKWIDPPLPGQTLILRITDASGRICYQADTITEPISIAEFHPGKYTVQVTIGKNAYQHTFIKP